MRIWSRKYQESRKLGICRIIWPTGPGGEIGSKGEINGLSAYGERYSVSTQ